MKEQEEKRSRRELKEEQKETRWESRKKRRRIRKLIILIVIIVIIVIVVAVFLNLISSGKSSKITKDDVITSSALEEVIDIGELSSAEFTYNGIADYYKSERAEENDNVTSNICYDAAVTIGINMEDVTFEVDDDTKTVTAALPELTITGVSVDTESLDYQPRDPGLTMQEVITLCKEDVRAEADQNEDLYVTAEDNLKSAIEAILLPVLEYADYTLEWAETETEGTEDEE